MDFGEGITLEYVPYATLKKYSELTARSYAETQKYLKYFSINPQGMKLCILVSEENYVWDYDNKHLIEQLMIQEQKILQVLNYYQMIMQQQQE